MARFGDRFRYHLGDFAEGSLPPDLAGPFDVVVSAAALHHLPGDRKRQLYRAIFERLAPGGGFFNLDSMAPQDEYLGERYRQVRDRRLAREGREEEQGGHGTPFAHYFEPVEEHLAWLTEAGFAHAHCFWKELGRALVGGYRL
jgi:tRNA (cmo5U34)-methyltransferase